MWSAAVPNGATIVKDDLKVKARQPSRPRAEQLREQRKGGNLQPSRARQRKQKSGPAHLPPVLVRGLATPDAAKSTRRKGKRVKRRYDIALPTPGVEMRLPALPVVRVGWRLLSFFMAVILSGLLYHLMTSPQYRVREITVHGAARLSDDSISRALLVYDKPIFMIQPEAVEQQLFRTFPGLVSAAVFVNFPAQINVEIAEREPVIVWEMETQSQWIDPLGMAFPPRGEAANLVRVVATAAPPAPIILEDEIDPEDGESQRPFMPVDLVEAILVLKGQAPEGIPIIFDGAHGFGWRDPNGWVVYFGVDSAEMSAKLNMYEAIVRQIKTEGIKPVLISMEYLHGPYFRLEQ